MRAGAGLLQPVVAALAILFGAGAQAATVTLVIDDLGYNRERARRALALAPPVAAAVLPGAPYARQIARAANRSRIELLVHLPMQGREQDLHTDILRADMDESRFRERVRHGLAAVPGAIGVNNHMGSVLTADAPAMALLMDELGAAPHRLLFLDSRTTADSVAQASAMEAGLATASRDVFLDHDLDPVAIERQFRRWLRRAQTTGCALAIAHPHPVTLSTLERLLPRMEGVRRVGLREYVRVCGTPTRPEAARIAAQDAELPERRRR